MRIECKVDVIKGIQLIKIKQIYYDNAESMHKYLGVQITFYDIVD